MNQTRGTKRSRDVSAGPTAPSRVKKVLIHEFFDPCHTFRI